MIYNSNGMQFYKFLRVFLPLFPMFIKAEENCTQSGPNADKCCEHFMLYRTTNTCIPCPIGYTGHGITCSLPCPYPSYGFQCQQKCSCPVDLCHFITGCPVSAGSTTEIEDMLTLRVLMTSVEILSKEKHELRLSTNDYKDVSIIETKNPKVTTKGQGYITIAIFCLSAFIVFGFCIYFKLCLPKTFLKCLKRCWWRKERHAETIQLA